MRIEEAKGRKWGVAKIGVELYECSIKACARPAARSISGGFGTIFACDRHVDSLNYENTEAFRRGYQDGEDHERDYWTRLRSADRNCPIERNYRPRRVPSDRGAAEQAAWEVDMITRFAKSLNQKEGCSVYIEATATVAPPSRYARSKTGWRRPMVHLAVGVTRGSTTDDPTQEVVDWECGGSSWTGTSWYDEVPEGFEVCQRCAEAVEFRQRRAAEQESPDRSAYNQRTAMLLAAENEGALETGKNGTPRKKVRW